MSYWLYGARLQWSALRTDQLAMRNDTRALLALRRAHPDVLHTNLCETHLIAIHVADATPEGHGKVLGYAPYARYIPGVKVVIVAANPSSDAPLMITLAIGPQVHMISFPFVLAHYPLIITVRWRQ